MKRRLWAAAMMAMLLLTGCWDRIEVNDIAIVTQVGLDHGVNGVKLTVAVVLPTRAHVAQSGEGGGGQQGRPVVTYSHEGRTVDEAISRLQQRVSRRLFWAHTRVLVIGEGLARQGIAPALDYWSRHREPRLLMQVVVTPGEAADFLEAQPPLERLISEAVRETINLQLQVRTTLKDLIEDLRNPAAHALLPRVTMRPGESVGDEVQVAGTAVFRGDRLAGWMDDEETRGLLWLRDEVETASLTVAVPAGGEVSLHVVRGSTRLRPYFQRGKLRMTVDVNMELEVVEATAGLDLAKEQALLLVEDQAGKVVRSRVRAALRRVQQEYRADVVGFGRAVRVAMPVRWERDLKHRWHQLFPAIPVQIQASALIRRTGGHGEPIVPPAEQSKKRAQEE